MTAAPDPGSPTPPGTDPAWVEPEPRPSSAGPARAASLPWGAFGLDVLLVLLFATLGRLSHAEGLTFGGLVTTASPFLAGTVGAWALLAARRSPRPATVAAGTLIWAMTLIVGMTLRAVTGQGVAVSFVIVAGLVTALFLIGWRAGGAWLVRRSAR